MDVYSKMAHWCSDAEKKKTTEQEISAYDTIIIADGLNGPLKAHPFCVSHVKQTTTTFPVSTQYSTVTAFTFLNSFEHICSIYSIRQTFLFPGCLFLQ